ncbi:MAG: small subunit ribosomal protein [Clostridiales bacterium]|jgi:small subunit ribosomal protein S6|nr:small subunit ribosomal protein [Clostridiales bacterium]MDK2932527.1 small subunit ribosomal protein [Clostridiales bacterium]
MVKVVNKYETIFIINPNLSEEETAGLVEKFKSLIESAGEVENVDEWGKRRLAYPINDYNEGYYVMIEFSAEPSLPQELERVYKITDGILRSIVIKKDKKKQA